MTRMDIELPDRARGFVEEQVAKGGYADASAYLLELVEREQQRALREEIEASLAAAAASPSSPLTQSDWDDIEREGMRVLTQRKGP